MKPRMSPARLAFAASAVLLAIGLGLDCGWVRGRMRAVESARGGLERTRAELATAEIRDRDSRRLRSYAEAHGLVPPAGVEDPLAWIGRIADRSGLTLIELSAVAPAAGVDGLVRSRFRLRAWGSYGAAVELVRNLESGPRGVAIDGLRMAPSAPGGPLETRLDLSVYDPPARAVGGEAPRGQRGGPR